MSSKVIKGTGDPIFDPTILELSRGKSIIPAETLLASSVAQEILEKARVEATRIREKATRILQEAVQEKEDERKRGHEEGYQEGLSQLTEAITSFEVERERALHRQEPEIIEMVLEIAQKVVARELKKGAVVDVVRQAVQKSVGKRLTVRVHPEDRKKITEENPLLTLVEDESITPGGCLVESELGTVDARLETQWKAIRKALGVEG